jgi:hypothetical protein
MTHLHGNPDLFTVMVQELTQNNSLSEQALNPFEGRARLTLASNPDNH